MDFINNVVYAWGKIGGSNSNAFDFAPVTGPTPGSKLDFIANEYIAGPKTDPTANLVS